MAQEKQKGIKKKIIAGVVTALAIGGITYGMIRLFSDPSKQKEIITDFVTVGSIETHVTGNAVTKPKKSATMTTPAAGVVREVWVEEGQYVTEGAPLFYMDSEVLTEAAEKAKETLDSARDTVSNCQKRQVEAQKDYDELQNDIQKNETERHIKVPFSGQLQNVRAVKQGEVLSEGTQVAELVDDSRFKLNLYFNYMYKEKITAGQKAQVSLPSAMRTVQGTVDEVIMSRRNTPEGGAFFEVVIAVPNTGSLTEGTVATAVLKGADNSDIYPYEAGELAYYRKEAIVTQVTGAVEFVDLHNYFDVTEGTEILRQKAENFTDQRQQKSDAIKAAKDATEDAQKSLAIAQAALDKAQDDLSKLYFTAPISGTVLVCSVSSGQEVAAGTAAVSIADTSVMMAEAQVDERNITYVKPGAICQITQWGRDGEELFIGTVESVSMEGKYENGISSFPATIAIENPDNKLLSGMYVDYELAASQSEDCMLVPTQAVKYTEFGTCLFVRTEEAPENALDLNGSELSVPEGFYAVVVEVGLSDSEHAEIISGVLEGMEVFVQYRASDDSRNGNEGFLSVM